MITVLSGPERKLHRTNEKLRESRSPMFVISGPARYWYAACSVRVYHMYTGQGKRKDGKHSTGQKKGKVEYMDLHHSRVEPAFRD